MASNKQPASLADVMFETQDKSDNDAPLFERVQKEQHRADRLRCLEMASDLGLDSADEVIEIAERFMRFIDVGSAD